MVRRMSEQNNHDTTNNSRRNPAAADGPSMQTAYFAGGCFWGLERYFQNVDGVTDTTVGYAQSKVESPSYELSLIHISEPTRRS